MTMNTSDIPSSIDFSDHSAVTRAIVSISNGAELALVAAQIKVFEEASKTATLSIENQTLFLEKISDIIEADNNALFQDKTCLFSISEVFKFWNRKIARRGSSAARRVWTQMFDLATLQILPRTTSNWMCAAVREMAVLAVDGHVDANRVGESTAAISTLLSMTLFGAVFELLPDLHHIAFKALVALPDEEIRIAAFEKLLELKIDGLELLISLSDHIDLRKFSGINAEVKFRIGFIATPLTVAAAWSSVPLCRKLVAAGADVDGFIIDPETKERKKYTLFRSPVIMAARNNDLTMVDFLIKECKADYKSVDFAGFDVMTGAICSVDRADGDHALINYLLNLDPEYFTAMLTVEGLARCIRSEVTFPFAAVGRIRSITWTYLLTRAAPESLRDKRFAKKVKSVYKTIKRDQSSESEVITQ
jgi:hypothetical protein